MKQTVDTRRVEVCKKELTRKSARGATSARRAQRRPPAALPPATHLPLQLVAGCELTNEHIHEYTSEYTNERTNQVTDMTDRNTSWQQ